MDLLGGDDDDDESSEDDANGEQKLQVRASHTY